MWHALARLTADPVMPADELSREALHSCQRVDVRVQCWGMYQSAFDKFVLEPVYKHVQGTSEWGSLFRSFAHVASSIARPMLGACGYELNADEVAAWRRRRPGGTRAGKGSGRASSTPAQLSAAALRAWRVGRPAWSCDDSQQLLHEFAALAAMKFTATGPRLLAQPTLSWLSPDEWTNIARRLWKVGSVLCPHLSLRT